MVFHFGLEHEIESFYIFNVFPNDCREVLALAASVKSRTSNFALSTRDGKKFVGATFARTDTGSPASNTWLLSLLS